MKKLYLFLFSLFIVSVGLAQLTTEQNVNFKKNKSAELKTLKSISTTLAAIPRVVYIQNEGDYPWDQNESENQLNANFGVNEWLRMDFQTADVAALLSSNVEFIFIDGSHEGNCEFIDFMNNYRSQLEDWVHNKGGSIFINSAPTECSTPGVAINTIAGVNLMPKFIREAYPSDVNHSFFGGNAASLYDVGYIAHTYIEGNNLTPILQDANGKAILAEKNYGKGKILYGGIPLAYFSLWQYNGSGIDYRSLFSNILQESLKASNINKTDYTFIHKYICENNKPYIFNNVAYHESGFYVHKFKNTENHDSLVFLNLKVEERIDTLVRITICESELPYKYNGYTFSEVIDTIYTFYNRGCGDTYQVKLKVIPIEVSEISQTICVSDLPFNFGTQTLTESGIFTETFTTNEGGCDSIVTLNLNIIEPVTETISETICANDLPYSFGDNMISQAGVYTLTEQAENGCDSLVTLKLVVLDNPEQPIIEVIGDTLTAPTANQYNWYQNDELISEYDKQQIIIGKSANYSLQIINQNGCKSDLSESVYITYSSIDDNLLKISTYPNPVKDQLIITGLPTTSKTEIRLYNIAGQLMLYRKSDSSIEKIDMSNNVSGIYLLKIYNNNINKNLKVIKE